MIRLGCAVRVLGKPGLKPYDTRRWQSGPHLSVSLAYVRDILHYLHKADIRMYRLASDLAPYITHPDFPEFHHQIDEALAELAHVGSLAREYGIRLTFHAPSHVVLSSSNPALVEQGMRTLNVLARMLNEMHLGPESVVVLHVGGGYENPAAALERFCRHVDQLPPETRQRLALEHDDTTFDLMDVLTVHERTGIPVVFDFLHHRLLNRGRVPLAEAVDMALRTWPTNVRAKLHLASPSTAARRVERKNPVTGERFVTVHPPLLHQHSDFIHPFDAIELLDSLRGRDVDVMVEAGGHDIALGKLRQDLQRLAPHLAAEVAGAPGRAVEETILTWEEWAGVEEEDGDRVLVVVMNNPRDFEIARDEGWYRIPVERAPDMVAADYLAFYLTKVFGPERWSIPYIAPVRRYRLARRRELLPEEGDHPRADAWYYKVEIGPLRRLPHPIPSRRLRRVTFIPTTLRRLLEAEEINDLWLGPTAQEQLYKALIRYRVPAVQEPAVGEGHTPYQGGIDIPCVDGVVRVLIADEEGAWEEDERTVILVPPEKVLGQLDAVVEQVLDRVRERGDTKPQDAESSLPHRFR